MSRAGHHRPQVVPIILGKNPKRERKIQSRSPVFCNSHLQPREPCGSRHHRPSKDTRTRPVRSRTSPSILNTKHTDKDRKLDEPPHGDHGAYKEPTRLSRTSSYLNSISLNLRPTDRLWAQDTHCVRWGGNLVGLRQLRGAQGSRQIGDMADKHAAARTSTTWPAPAATTPKAPRTTRGDAQGNGRKTASQRLRAHRGLTLHIDEPDKEPTSPMEAIPVSAFVRIGDRGLTSHIGGPLRHQTRRRRQRCHRAHCHKPTKGNSDCSRGSASSPSSRNRRGVRRCPDLGH